MSTIYPHFYAAANILGTNLSMTPIGSIMSGQGGP